MSRRCIAGQVCSSVAPALLAAALGGCASEQPPIYQGYVEGEFVHVASPVGGRLERLLVQRGQIVEAEAPLFVLEAVEETAARLEVEAQLKAAEAELADLETGERAPELAVVRAQREQAVAAEEESALQLARREALFADGVIPRGQLDEARARHAIDVARVQELSHQLAVSDLPARGARIRAQAAQVAAQRAALEQADWRVGQKQVSASAAGLVADTLYRDGEWVPAGSPVVRMLPPANVKVRFFVPETIAGGLTAGRPVVIRCDGCRSEIDAAVSWVSVEPEYTPPVIYSNETRAKLVFLVEARPAIERAPELRPGQPVAVLLR